MTSETPNLHVSKNLNISKTKQDIEKLKTPLRLVWKCCSIVFKIGSKIFSLQWHFKCYSYCCSNQIEVAWLIICRLTAVAYKAISHRLRSCYSVECGCRPTIEGFGSNSEKKSYTFAHDFSVLIAISIIKFLMKLLSNEYYILLLCILSLFSLCFIS